LKIGQKLVKNCYQLNKNWSKEIKNDQKYVKKVKMWKLVKNGLLILVKIGQEWLKTTVVILVKSCKEKNELKLVKTGQNGKKY
jgi:hypothetical protein